MSRSALQRVLRAERSAMLGGVATIRQKIISSLASLFSDDYKDRKCDLIHFNLQFKNQYFDKQL